VSDQAGDDEAPDHEPPLPSGSVPLPELDFATFVMSIIGSAFVHLGDAPDPEAGTIAQAAVGPNLLLARQDIELLGLLQDKTRGNLSGEEERILSQGLYDLRMRYVEVARGR
jgi:hypothetical protein